MLKLTERILAKSNSYNYYKNNYKKFLAKNNNLINENEDLRVAVSSYKSDIKEMENENEDLRAAVSSYKSEINEIETKNANLTLVLKKILGQSSKSVILNKLINEEYSDITIAIKSPHPKGTYHWGDYFFSLSLKKSFEKKGFNVIIHPREEWYDNDIKADINLVLRGLVEYTPNFDEINLMWNISHPDMIEMEEYENYDICFISSYKYADQLKNNLKTTVKPLLQCSDPDVFFTEKEDSIAEDILFVGMTRGVYREIIKDVLKTEHDVSIYGGGWENFIDEKFIQGEFIDNGELHKYYSSSKILLNDHWQDMLDMDFPSNRLFDALACGTFVISDKIPSAKTIFEDTIITYEDADDLDKKLEYYLAHDEERRAIAERGKELVLNYHTFDNRVDSILDSLKNLNLNFPSINTIF